MPSDSLSCSLMPCAIGNVKTGFLRLISHNEIDL